MERIAVEAQTVANEGSNSESGTVRSSLNRPVPPGLPEVLSGGDDGWQRLRKCLDLTKGVRQAMWSTTEFDRRFRDLLAKKPMSHLRPGEKDRVAFTAYYSVPSIRRNGFFDWCMNPTGKVDDGLLFPSLEYVVLKAYAPERLTELDSRIRDEPARTSFCTSLWEAAGNDLRTWDSLDSKRRELLVLVVFSIATLMDDTAPIREAISLVPELAEEFGNLLQFDEPASTSNPEEDILVTWARLCTELANLATAAAGPPPRIENLARIRGILADMDRAVEPVRVALLPAATRTGLNDVLAFIDERLKGLSDNPAFEWVREPVVSRLLARWRIAGEQSPKAFDAEMTRIATSIEDAKGDYVALVRQIAEGEHLLRTLADECPDPGDLVAHDDWLERKSKLENHHADLVRRRVQQRDRLLAVLSPSGATYDPRFDYVAEWAQLQASGESAAESLKRTTPPAEPAKDVADAPASQAIEDAEVADTVPPVVLDPSEFRRDQPPVSVPPAPVVVVQSPSGTHTPSAGTNETTALDAIRDALTEESPDFAFCYHLALALEAAGREPPLAGSEFFGSAALAAAIRSPDGALASRLRESLSEFEAPAGIADPQTRLTIGLLILAAALPTALLAGHSGAVRALLEPRLAEGLDDVFKFAKSVGERCSRLQGHRIDPTVLRSARTQTAWDAELQQQRTEAQRWREQARYRTILYSPATAVWQHWLKPKGVLHRLLDIVCSGARERTDEVEALIADLTDDFDALVRRTDHQDLGRRHGADIHARAYQRLHANAQEAVAIARNYLALLAARPDSTDFLAAAIRDLRQDIAQLAGPARATLARLVSEHPHTVLAAAAHCADRGVVRMAQLLDPERLEQGREPDVDAVLDSALLRIPSLYMRADRYGEEGSSDTVKELLRPGARLSYDDAFEAYLRARRHDAAGRLVAWTEASVPGAAGHLRAKLEASAAQRTAELRREIEEVRLLVEQAVAAGHLAENDRARHDATLVAVTDRCDSGEVVRFDVEMDALAKIRSALDLAAQQQKQAAFARLLELGLDPDSPAANIIRAHIDRGDVLTAHELIARHRAGDDVTGSGASSEIRDPLLEFWPERARQIVAELEAVRNFASVIDLVRQRQTVGGMNLASVPGAQIDNAVGMLTAWFALKRAERFDARQVVTLRQLFDGLGFATQSCEIKATPNRVAEAALHTTPLRDRGSCPVPMFGSGTNGIYRILGIWERPSEEEILQHAEGRAGSASTIVLYFGRLSEKRRDELARLARKKARSLVLLDETLLLFLCGERGSRLPVLFACALPFTYVQPYVTTAGIVPPEMFFGREHELGELTAREGPCFIYGGRQLGKTALLRSAERAFHQPVEQRFAAWADLKAEGVGYDREPAEIWRVVWRVLRDAGVLSADIQEPNPNVRGRVESFIDRLRQWLHADKRRRILLLLDEADRFLEIDARESTPGESQTAYREASRLKGLMDSTERSLKIVFAGLHNVLRTASQSNHPLGHFGQPINIGPLLDRGAWRAAESLVLQPLQAAGYRFESPALVTRILARTNYYPSLIQIYGQALLRDVIAKEPREAPPYRITEAMVDGVYRARNVREAIRDRFHLTLQLDPRYEVIAYAIAYETFENDALLVDGIDLSLVDDAVRKWWGDGFRDVEKGTGELASLLDEMVGLGVLRQVSNRQYTLRNPNVRVLMGTQEEVGDNLLRPREEPKEFEPAAYRARDPREPESPVRNPLTYQQERQLRADSNGVAVVAGVRASGIDSVTRFLRHRGVAGNFQELPDLTSLKEFSDMVGKTTDREEGTKLVVVPPSAPWSEEWIDRALEQTAKLHAKGRYVRFVFLADPLGAWRLLAERKMDERAALAWLSLRPWNADFLRQWADDVGLTNDVTLREELRSVTGGWPTLVMRWFELFQRGARGNSASALLTRELQSPESAQSRLADFGLDDPLAAAILRPLAELGEASTDDIHGFAEESVPVTATDVALRLLWASRLHLAVQTGEDAWRIDPVVATVMKASAS